MGGESWFKLWWTRMMRIGSLPCFLSREADEMVAFQCEWIDEQMTSERSGFDLGHMTFAGGKGTCTSRGKTPDQAMMLAIAIKELLYGLETLLRGAQSEHKFVGADSSFSVWFKKSKRGRISVRCGTTELGEAESTELCKSILQGVET